MGCTASCPANFKTQFENPSSDSSPTHWKSRLLSPSCSFSEPSLTPISRTVSLSTPLIHHPPIRKGDSNHFVSLTSSTYGSLDVPNVDFDHPNVETKKIQDLDADSEDPLSPDSVINTWELMEGLDEEDFDFQVVDYPKEDCGRRKDTSTQSYEEMIEQNDKSEKVEDLKCSNSSSLSIDCQESSICLLGAEDRIVLFYTSLRGIRKTYEDCCMIRVIFRGLRVCVDERDISLDRSYRKELEEAFKGKAVSLPQVFMRGRYIGGAEEIKQLNETGKLAKFLEDFALVDPGFACQGCGDVRFVPCTNCNGSRKVYDDEEGSFRCRECNENGLTRCPLCCP